MTDRQPANSGGTAEVPAATVAAWRRAEEQLYLATLSGPGSYQRSVELVGRTVEHLRGLGAGCGVLLAAGAQGPALVQDLPPGRALDTCGLDLALVAQAALALRWREMVGEQVALGRLAALRRARDDGLAWVVLEEAGDPDGEVSRPYRRLEAHPRTGHAVLITTAPDEHFTGCLHAVEAVRVDLGTGVLREARNTGETHQVHDDAGARESGVAALRARLTDS